MSGFRPHTIFCMLIALLLSACASSPPESIAVNAVSSPDKLRQNKKPASERNELVSIRLDGAAPVLNRNGADKDGAVASNFSVGIDRLLQYQARWSIEPGDVLSLDHQGSAGQQTPTRFGGQHIGQNVMLQLPELAGAPLSLAVSSEVENNWLLGGSTQLQRERANISWSPDLASVNVQWTGTAALLDDHVALVCDLQSSVRLPTHEGSGHSEALRLSGSSCFVPYDGTAYSGTEAQTWGLSYVWGGLKRQSEAALSVIDPNWTADFDYQDIRPAYALGLSHRRDFGSLSAKGLVSLRQGSVINGASALELAEHYPGRGETNWATNASLTWQWPDASLSANWAKGIDRLWFTPDVGQRSDRFGLALNLSQWVEFLMPESSPQFAMNWNWSEVRLPNAEVTESHALRLDIALMF